MKQKQVYRWMFWMLVMGVQLSAQPTPISFGKEFRDKYGIQSLPTETIPAFDLAKVQREDEGFYGQSRFAAPLPVDLGLQNAGQWMTLADGSRLWRMRMNSKGALALILLFDRFYLPPGATLFLYGSDQRQVLGPFDQQNNQINGKYVLGPLNGETAILEYHEPKAAAGQGQLHLFRLDHAYHRDNLKAFEKNLEAANDIGFNTSLPCNTNINCPEGDAFQKEKRAVCRIMMILEEGTGFCTGSLMNNTNRDGKPYVLTAFHCQDGYTPKYDLWRFDFGYEAPGCEKPGQAPVPLSALGCTRRAGRQANDFLLLETTAALPVGASPFFLGWSRVETPPQSAWIIHHPNGDIKKIASDDDPAVINPRSINWNNDVTTPASHHFTLVYDQGTFELGSSGAALLDQDKRVVGQLHGGFNACSETTGYFGRLSLAWEGGGTPQTRLKDWLDPAGKGPITLDGMFADEPSPGILAGKVMLEDGRAIANVKVFLSGNNFRDSTVTDAGGNYRFENVPMMSGYGISAVKTETARNGVSALDLILIQKHLLSSKPLDSRYKILAADVNESHSVSLIDLVKIRKVLLGAASGFDGRRVWHFLPAGFTFSDPLNPFSTSIPNTFFIMDFSGDLLNFDLIGYKAGDVNNSVDPAN